MQHDIILAVDQAGSVLADRAMRLAIFIRRMLGRHGRGGAARITAVDKGFAEPTELSRSVAPIAAASHLVTFDLANLRRLRDYRKIAILAPDGLERDLAALNDTPRRRLAVLAELQDALRNCTSTIVFNACHVAPLLALGAPRVDLVRQPALMPLQDMAPTIDLLLIAPGGDGGVAMCLELGRALNQALPDLTVRQTGRQAGTDTVSGLCARIHIHVGAPADTAAALRVIDSHALQRPVIYLATHPASDDPAMQVEPMRSGLCATTIAEAIGALQWLEAHRVFIEIFRGNAMRLVEIFNAEAEAQLSGALRDILV